MPLAGFEPTVPASELPQTHTLDREATGIGHVIRQDKLAVGWRFVLIVWDFPFPRGKTKMKLCPYTCCEGI
jgi:hypothetical protein